VLCVGKLTLNDRFAMTSEGRASSFPNSTVERTRISNYGPSDVRRR
jgi:hypothetical protein